MLRFSPGDIVLHLASGLRGVVVEVDAQFCGPDHLLTDFSGQRGPKRSPWYHVALEGSHTSVYIAECNLVPTHLKDPVQNSLITSVFTEFSEGRYIRPNH